MKKHVIDLGKVSDQIREQLGDNANIVVVGLHCSVVPDKDVKPTYANQLGFGDFDFDVEKCIIEVEVPDDFDDEAITNEDEDNICDEPIEGEVEG